jgi:D-erythronate 2-dehydrogenase
MQAQEGAVLITGGLGFIGLNLAKKISQKENLLFKNVLSRPSRIILVDHPKVKDTQETENLKNEFLKYNVNLEIQYGDISSSEFVSSIVSPKRNITSIFHLASVMSGQGEEDFGSALTTNLYGTINLLEATRSCNNNATFVFSSTGAVFGRNSVIQMTSESDGNTLFCPSDGTKFLPETTYGMTKACCEALINDYNRKGFIKGRSARLPTVIVRPGAPNAATTSIFSGIVREPLNGETSIVQIPMDMPHPVISHRSVIDSLIQLHNTEEETFKRHGFGIDRAANLHASPVTLNELYQHASNFATSNDLKFGNIEVNIDTNLSNIVGSMVSDVECQVASALDLPGKNVSAGDMVKFYAEDFLGLTTTTTNNNNSSNATNKMPEISFIGLGNMGIGMVENLIKNDFVVHIYNRTLEKAEEFKLKYPEKAGSIHVYKNLSDLIQSGKNKSMIFSVCLLNEEICRDILIGNHSNSILSNLKRKIKGNNDQNERIVVLDHSTCSLKLSMECHKTFSEQFSNVTFLDAPISGGPEGAKNGTLSIMCGGNKDSFEVAKKPLQAMGSRVVLMGDEGAGTATKLINQLLVGIHSVAANEALVFSKKLGLRDLNLLNDLIKDSWGYSKIFERCLSVLNDVDYNVFSKELEQSGAPVKNLCKDLNIIINEARENGIELKIAEEVADIYHHVENDLKLGNGDMAILGRLYPHKRN